MDLSLSQQPAETGTNGLRPINLRTDLAPLADLIELVFADNMDNSGRAALREMRMMSRIGVGLNVISRMNDMALGINMGYVWIEDGQLIGNVSIYPANWPRDLGSAWIIANVGVHPNYQRRGIARKLMIASLEMIRARGGDTAILQVDYLNEPAKNLYLSLGFIHEGVWTMFRRSAVSRLLPEINLVPAKIVHRRSGEWRSEYALAQRVRPESLGGIGWQRPLHSSLFRPGWFKWLDNLLNLRNLERLVIRSEDRREIVASMWIETAFGTSTRLTLMVLPEFSGRLKYDDALINTTVRRFGTDNLVIEHPQDHTETLALLEHYRFQPQRTVIHMRWKAH
ncbi:MAG: GNAT family N-acetyltransferase [Anaerolineae bacterium]|nr:GNAT family N-acetyltransferase [Anaerolineae bacterium]